MDDGGENKEQREEGSWREKEKIGVTRLERNKRTKN